MASAASFFPERTDETKNSTGANRDNGESFFCCSVPSVTSCSNPFPERADETKNSTGANRDNGEIDFGFSVSSVPSCSKISCPNPMKQLLKEPLLHFLLLGA